MILPTTLDPKVRDVLLQCTVQGKLLKLPVGLPIEKPLAEALMALIKEAGGVWGAKSGGYLFTKEPRELFAIDFLPTLPPSMGGWDRPPTIAAAAPGVTLSVDEQAVRIAEAAFQFVLVPNCGDGTIARAALTAGAAGITVVDMDLDRLTELGAEINQPDRVNLYQGDFFSIGLKPGDFERVVMHPPLNLDLKYVQRALRFLAPRGRLVAVLAPDISLRGFNDITQIYDYQMETVGEHVILSLKNK